jgi:hypothetical protein
MSEDTGNIIICLIVITAVYYFLVRQDENKKT